jgi:hypothetical protein
VLRRDRVVIRCPILDMTASSSRQRHGRTPFHAEPDGAQARPARPGKAVRIQGFEGLRRVHRELERQARERAEQAAREARERVQREREKALFAHLVGPVVPMKCAGKAHIERPRPAPVPLQRQLDEQEVLRSSLSDEFDAVTLMETDD